MGSLESTLLSRKNVKVEVPNERPKEVGMLGGDGACSVSTFWSRRDGEKTQAIALKDLLWALSAHWGGGDDNTRLWPLAIASLPKPSSSSSSSLAAAPNIPIEVYMQHQHAGGSSVVAYLPCLRWGWAASLNGRN